MGLPVRLSGVLIAVFCLALPVAAETAASTAHTGMVPLVMRWTHILAAIVMLGGGVFLRFVLLPAAEETLDADTHARLRAAVRGRWMKWVSALILLFLLSGFYNYLFVTRFAHQGNPQYHMLFGIKFLLSMVVFFLAMVLVGRSGLAQRLQANNRVWLAVLVVLGGAVVLLGGYMRLLG